MRAREAALWEMEERHIHDKQQLVKKQLKDIFFLQRHQVHIWVLKILFFIFYEETVFDPGKCLDPFFYTANMKIFFKSYFRCLSGMIKN